MSWTASTFRALSFTAPSILGEWHVPSSEMGSVFALGNLGVLLGSVFFTMAADKTGGAGPVLIIGTFFFSVLTILTGFAATMTSLLVIRLIAGIGIGSIVPNATALVEMNTALAGAASPSAMVDLLEFLRRRDDCGICFPPGCLFSPAWGWRSVFYWGGILPLLIAGF